MRMRNTDSDQGSNDLSPVVFSCIKVDLMQDGNSN